MPIKKGSSKSSKKSSEKKKEKIAKELAPLISDISIKKQAKNKWLDSVKIEGNEKKSGEKIEEKKEVEKGIETNEFHESLEGSGNFVAPVINSETNSLDNSLRPNGNSLEGTASAFNPLNSGLNSGSDNISYSTKSTGYLNSSQGSGNNYETINGAEMTFLGSRNENRVFSPFVDGARDTWSHKSRDTMNPDESERFNREQQQEKIEAEERAKLPFQEKKRKTEIF